MWKGYNWCYCHYFIIVVVGNFYILYDSLKEEDMLFYKRWSFVRYLHSFAFFLFPVYSVHVNQNHVNIDTRFIFNSVKTRGRIFTVLTNVKNILVYGARISFPIQSILVVNAIQLRIFHKMRSFQCFSNDLFRTYDRVFNVFA